MSYNTYFLFLLPRSDNFRGCMYCAASRVTWWHSVSAMGITRRSMASSGVRPPERMMGIMNVRDLQSVITAAVLLWCCATEDAIPTWDLLEYTSSGNLPDQDRFPKHEASMIIDAHPINVLLITSFVKSMGRYHIRTQKLIDKCSMSAIGPQYNPQIRCFMQRERSWRPPHDSQAFFYARIYMKIDDTSLLSDVIPPTDASLVTPQYPLYLT